MTLGEKLRYLREVEGTLRGLGRAMTQQELAAAIREQTGRPISQSYLSQIESGARRHLTATTRTLLARFFKVHPGYLVDDPEGFHTELISGLRTPEDSLDVWVREGAGRFRGDVAVTRALEALARRPDSRRCLVLLGAILDAPGLAERLMHVLTPESPPGAGDRSAE